MILTVYVPTEDSAPMLGIRPGSGIVGTAEPAEERIRIDFEGNVYDSAELRTYAARVFHAAGRHIERYPTVARAWVPAHRLDVVGRWDHERRTLTITDTPSLARWLGRVDDQVPEAEFGFPAWYRGPR